jgi:hypothetical protein
LIRANKSNDHEHVSTVILKIVWLEELSDVYFNMTLDEMSDLYNDDVVVKDSYGEDWANKDMSGIPPA